MKEVFFHSPHYESSWKQIEWLYPRHSPTTDPVIRQIRPHIPEAKKILLISTLDSWPFRIMKSGASTKNVVDEQPYVNPSRRYRATLQWKHLQDFLPFITGESIRGGVVEDFLLVISAGAERKVSEGLMISRPWWEARLPIDVRPAAKSDTESSDLGDVGGGGNNSAPATTPWNKHFI